MEQNKKRARRIDISVNIRLKDIQGNIHPGYSSELIEVKVVNISKTGIAFKSPEKLAFNGFYDTDMIFPNKEKFDALLQVVRMDEPDKNGLILYGCSFIGINSADQFKIDVYQVLYDFDRVEK